MKKSVYSLVLSDEVIEAIDLLAYKRGTSRSNLINQLLAESAGFITDQKRMEEIHAHAVKLLERLPQLRVSLKSDTVLAIRAPLSFKYNPTLLYSATVLQRDRALEGEIKVSLRSQSRELIFHLKRFFLFWSKIEQAYGTEPRFVLEGDRFSRQFAVAERIEADHLRQAQMIVSYAAAMSDAFGEYFGSLGDMMQAVKGIEKIYLEYLSESRDII